MVSSIGGAVRIVATKGNEILVYQMSPGVILPDQTESTPEQVRIATDIVRLAERALTTGARIHAQAMTLDDWRTLSDAYSALGEQAEEQARLTEACATPIIGRLPRLSEIVWAQGKGDDVHWVVVPGRKHQAEPCDGVERLALCGESAVPVQILGKARRRLCDVCRERLRVIHQRIAEELT